LRIPGYGVANVKSTPLVASVARHQGEIHD
jgi:hypothetical protein